MTQRLNLFTSNPAIPPSMQNISFIGLGRIGLPQALVMANKGFNVTAFDINAPTVQRLVDNQVPFEEPMMANYLDKNLNKTFFPKVLTEEGFVLLRQMDAIIFTLGTPTPTNQNSLENNNSDLSAHLALIDNLFLSDFNKGLILIFRTTFPLGATDEIKQHIEINYSLREGCDFHMAYVPERLMEGCAIHEEETLPKIIGTYNDEAFRLVNNLYHKISSMVIRVESPKAAEFCKLADNAYRNTLFAFSNDLAMLGNEIGINTLAAIYAINYSYLRNNLPVPGFVSGYCLVKDPYILEQSFNYRHFHSVWHAGRKSNDYLITYTSEKILKQLKDPTNKRISILGLAFKKDIDDFRMSHSFLIIEQLIERGFRSIDIYDPFINNNNYTQIPIRFKSSIDRTTKTLNKAFFASSDAIIVCQKHQDLITAGQNNELQTLLSEVSNTCYIFDG